MPMLLKISLIISIFGILLLLFLSLSQKPLEIPCDELNNFSIKDKSIFVSFTGIVLSEKEITKDFKTIYIESQDQECSILATCNFCQGIIFKNSTIKLFGKIEIYQEKPEIIADEIQIIKR